jgi:hypothetical protein
MAFVQGQTGSTEIVCAMAEKGLIQKDNENPMTIVFSANSAKIFTMKKKKNNTRYSKKKVKQHCLAGSISVFHPFCRFTMVHPISGFY